MPESHDEPRPARVLDVHLENPLPAIEPSPSRLGIPYASARVLVRLHSVPLGEVVVDLTAGPIDPESLATSIWTLLEREICEHLAGDGLDASQSLSAEGLPAATAASPPCQATRLRTQNDAPAVTVVIPTMRRPDRLADCLRSVLGSDYPIKRFEVVVVDNAPSEEATRQYVGELAAQGAPVTYVPAHRPGASHARNRGIETASHDLILFIDDDVVVDRYWMVEMVAAFEAGENVGCVTGLVLPLELETPAQMWFEEYGGFGKGFAQRTYDLGPNRPRDVPLFPFSLGLFGSGNSMAFTRSALHDIGEFDATIGNGTPVLGGEDIEIFLRHTLRGHQTVYQPTALVRHKHRESYEELERQLNIYGVSVSAIITRTILRIPSSLPMLLRRLPYGIYCSPAPSSPKNRGKTPTFRRALHHTEVRGMLTDPWVYLRSRMRSSRTFRDERGTPRKTGHH